MNQNVSNLVNDLASCEKLVNKNTSNGYCGLNNGLINVTNIPNLPESVIINLTSDLLNKADLISGYLKSSEIPLSVPLNINYVTTSNNIINLTTDIIIQGTINKYMALPILESNVTLIFHYIHFYFEITSNKYNLHMFVLEFYI